SPVEERPLKGEGRSIVRDRVNEALGQRERTSVERREDVSREVVIEDPPSAAHYAFGPAKWAPRESDARLEVVEVAAPQRPCRESCGFRRHNGNLLRKQWVHIAVEDGLIWHDQPPVGRVHVEDDVPLVMSRLVVIPADTIIQGQV